MFQLFSVALSLSVGVVLKQQQKSECTKRFHILTFLILPSSKVSAVLGRPSCRCGLRLSPSSVYPNTLFRLLWKLYSGFSDLPGIICTIFFLMEIWLCSLCFLGLGHLQLWRLRHPVLCGFSLIYFDLSGTRRAKNRKGRMNCSTQFPVFKMYWVKM